MPPRLLVAVLGGERDHGHERVRGARFAQFLLRVRDHQAAAALGDRVAVLARHPGQRLLGDLRGLQVAARVQVGGGEVDPQVDGRFVQALGGPGRDALHQVGDRVGRTVGGQQRPAALPVRRRPHRRGHRGHREDLAGQRDDLLVGVGVLVRGDPPDDLRQHQRRRRGLLRLTLCAGPVEAAPQRRHAVAHLVGEQQRAGPQEVGVRVAVGSLPSDDPVECGERVGGTVQFEVRARDPQQRRHDVAVVGRVGREEVDGGRQVRHPVRVAGVDAHLPPPGEGPVPPVLLVQFGEPPGRLRPVRDRAGRVPVDGPLDAASVQPAGGLQRSRLELLRQDVEPPPRGDRPEHVADAAPPVGEVEQLVEIVDGVDRPVRVLRDRHLHGRGRRRRTAVVRGQRHELADRLRVDDRPHLVALPGRAVARVEPGRQLRRERRQLGAQRVHRDVAAARLARRRSPQRRRPVARRRRAASTSAAAAANPIAACGFGARSSQPRCRSRISSPRASFPVSPQNSRCSPMSARSASCVRFTRYARRCMSAASAGRPVRRYTCMRAVWTPCGCSEQVSSASSTGAAISSASSNRPASINWYIIPVGSQPAQSDSPSRSAARHFANQSSADSSPTCRATAHR
ncbi:hypothetical protein BJF79_32190 [Actinomadura sp. CNU-125]|nr:hypothetical protein BJF79_32190 [Actinomadura sp. CNU-125]